jgi:hypothetical protein
MKSLFVIGLFVVTASCQSKSGKTESSTNDTTKTETQQSNSSNTQTGNSVTTSESSLAIDPVPYPGSVAYAVFQKGGQTLFYYNVDTKQGLVKVNGMEHKFTSYEHQINEPDYILKAGDDLTIKVEGTQFAEYENPEPGILKGKAAKVTVTLADGKLELTDVDVVDGTNAD